MNKTATNLSLLTALTLATSTSLVHAEPATATESDSVISAAQLTAAIDRTDASTVRPARRHRLMALELAGIMTAGTSWYWRDNGQANVVDWQLPWDARALGAKVGIGSDGWRFDGNDYAINALGHPGFGALTYFLARTNHYSAGESFLISTAASGAWELFIEWAEYGSINDILATSTTGVPIGEAAYQLMKHWRSARFEVHTGVGAQDRDGFGVVGARAALNMLPSTGSGWITGGRKVSAAIELPFDGEGARSYEGAAKTSLAGYYHNAKDAALFAGASAEFNYREQKDRPAHEWDRLATISAGPTLDAQFRTGGATVDVGTDVYLDFGMVKSAALDTWRAGNALPVLRNSMQDKAKPYYYGKGLTMDPRINVAYRGANIGGKVAARMFGSIDGYDRDQEMLTMDPHMTDTDTTGQAWLAYSLRNTTVTLDSRVHHRGGEIAGTRVADLDTTTMLTVGYER